MTSPISEVVGCLNGGDSYRCVGRVAVSDDEGNNYDVIDASLRVCADYGDGLEPLCCIRLPHEYQLSDDWVRRAGSHSYCTGGGSSKRSILVRYSNAFDSIAFGATCSCSRSRESYNITMSVSIKAEPLSADASKLTGAALSLASLAPLVYESGGRGECLCAVLEPLASLTYTERCKMLVVPVSRSSTLLSILRCPCILAAGGSNYYYEEGWKLREQYKYMYAAHLAYAAARSLGLASILAAAGIPVYNEYVDYKQHHYPYMSREINSGTSILLPYSFATGLRVAINSIIEAGGRKNNPISEAHYSQSVSMEQVGHNDWVAVSYSGALLEESEQEQTKTHNKVMSVSGLLRVSYPEVNGPSTDYTSIVKVMGNDVSHNYTPLVNLIVNTSLAGASVEVAGGFYAGVVASALTISGAEWGGNAKPLNMLEHFNLSKLKIMEINDQVKLLSGGSRSLDGVLPGISYLARPLTPYPLREAAEYLVSLAALGLLPDSLPHYKLDFSSMRELVALVWNDATLEVLGLSASAYTVPGHDHEYPIRAAMAASIMIDSVAPPYALYRSALSIARGVEYHGEDSLGRRLIEDIEEMDGATLAELVEIIKDVMDISMNVIKLELGMRVERRLTRLLREAIDAAERAAAYAIVHAARSLLLREARRAGIAVAGGAAAALTPVSLQPETTSKVLDDVTGKEAIVVKGSRGEATVTGDTTCVALAGSLLAETVTIGYIAGDTILLASTVDGESTRLVAPGVGGRTTTLLAAKNYGAAACRLSKSSPEYVKPTINCIAV